MKHNCKSLTVNLSVASIPDVCESKSKRKRKSLPCPVSSSLSQLRLATCLSNRRSWKPCLVRLPQFDEEVRKGFSGKDTKPLSSDRLFTF